jgi:hypothetical protein
MKFTEIQIGSFSLNEDNSIKYKDFAKVKCNIIKQLLLLTKEEVLCELIPSTDMMSKKDPWKFCYISVILNDNHVNMLQNIKGGSRLSLIFSWSEDYAKRNGHHIFSLDPGKDISEQCIEELKNENQKKLDLKSKRNQKHETGTLFHVSHTSYKIKQIVKGSWQPSIRDFFLKELHISNLKKK